MLHYPVSTSSAETQMWHGAVKQLAGQRGNIRGVAKKEDPVSQPHKFHLII